MPKLAHLEISMNINIHPKSSHDFEFFGNLKKSQKNDFDFF
jgi:hypothetical protein